MERWKVHLFKNEFRHYKSPKTGILKDSRLIIGNPNSKEFMVFIENGNQQGNTRHRFRIYVIGKRI